MVDSHGYMVVRGYGKSYIYIYILSTTLRDVANRFLQLISLIFGRNFHIFKPPNISADDEEFPVNVLIQQARYFGPFPLTYATYLDKEEEQVLAAIHILIEEQDSRKPFPLVEDKELTLGDKEFLCRVMELDPMERPTAKELLTHSWFDQQ